LPDVVKAMGEADLREYLQLLEVQDRLERGLPHLYGQKHYKWSREFFESLNKICLCTAANQIGKSTNQIKKCIHWATDKDLWPRLWKGKPSQFWYLYPSAKQALVEFYDKWEPLLPQGDFKSDPTFGWNLIMRAGEIFAIRFNSGVTVYFKYYSQKVATLQSSTVHAVFADEEMPDHLIDEIMLRTAAVDGYFSMVFTATLGQDVWRRAMEPAKGETEAFPEAFKIQVSMYDCLEFEDGSPGLWTHEKIRIIEQNCRNDAEKARRVYGKFVKDSGLEFPKYDPSRHFITWHPVPKTWHIFAGADIGGGGSSHPAAVVFVAVSPDYKEGRVVAGWRGDFGDTTAGDVLTKLQELVSEWESDHGVKIVNTYYDWASKDFGTLAARAGVPVTKADKTRKVGINLVNTLFQNDVLKIYDTPELQKLSLELLQLSEDTVKSKRKDDFCDALRYAVASIPWNLECLAPIAKEEKKLTLVKVMSDMEKARRGIEDAGEILRREMESEFAEWNEAYGN